MKSKTCALLLIAALAPFEVVSGADDHWRVEPIQGFSGWNWTLAPIPSFSNWTPSAPAPSEPLRLFPYGKPWTPWPEPEKTVNANDWPAVPPDVLYLARRAKEESDEGNFAEAERLYDKALTIAPNNVYLLSNKAVCQFRQRKYREAEETFRQAIPHDPENDFNHCTLGIVLYQRDKLDDAIQELTRALAINPKNATAHNYLGISASKKGWEQAARKEVEAAIAIDANYADAHFNLALLLASQTPPDKKAARDHYRRAIDLGGEPDTSLEQMIK